MAQHNDNPQSKVARAAYIPEDTAADANVPATGRSVGLTPKFKKMGIGMVPAANMGATVGFSAYGLKRFVNK